MEVRTLKFISIPIILVVNFIVGICPYFLISNRIRKLNRRTPLNSPEISDTFFVSPTMKRFLSLANFFCGGVFLATSLIGLYPGVNSKFNDILKKRPSVPEYPYAALSLGVGFFVVWILEILVHACLHFHSQKTNLHDHDHDHDHNHDHNHDHGHIPIHTVEHNNIQNNSNVIKMNFLNLSQPASPVFPDDQTPQASDRLLNVDDNIDEDKDKLSETVQITTANHAHEAHSHVPMKGNLLGSIMLTFALGSHSIIEGLGYAMIASTSMTINMLVTVLIHESICALSLGVNLASKKSSLVASLALLGTFSALIPVGISIGMLVNLGLEKNILGETVTAILQGIAAGTFIYVVFMEILPAEVTQHTDEHLKVILMIMGFSLIATMKIFHTHGDKLNCASNSSNVSYIKLTHRH